MSPDRRLRRMLDRLATDGARWAPLAGGVETAELVHRAADRLAGLAPDPLAALDREYSAPATAQAEPISTATRRLAAVPPRQGKFPQAVRRLSSATIDTPTAEVTAPVPLPAQPRFRVAQATTPVLRMSAVPPVPPDSRPAVIIPALPVSSAHLTAHVTMATADLARRLASPAARVTVDAQRLRAMAEPAAVRLASRKDQVRSAATAPPINRPPSVELASARATPATSAKPSPTAPSFAPIEERPVRATGQRGSALSDLLRRWPTTGDHGTNSAETASAPIAAERGRLATSLPGPLTMPGTVPAVGGFAVQVGSAPPTVPVGDLPRPVTPTNDLQFGRTLERVLLAEVRRQGLNVDSP